MTHPNLLAARRGRDEYGDPAAILARCAEPSLPELLQSGPLSPERAAELVGGVATALDALAAAGLVGRDLTPEHVHLDPRRGGILADVAIPFEVLERPALESDEHVAYRAPEQLTGGDLDLRSNVYSLGVLLFTALVGEPPFGGTWSHVYVSHLDAPRPRLTDARRELPRAIDDVIAKAMAIDPAERYESASDFARATADALDVPLPGAVSAAEEPPAEPASAAAEVSPAPARAPSASPEPAPAASPGPAPAPDATPARAARTKRAPAASPKPARAARAKRAPAASPKPARAARTKRAPAASPKPTPAARPKPAPAARPKPAPAARPKPAPAPTSKPAPAAQPALNPAPAPVTLPKAVPEPAAMAVRRTLAADASQGARGSSGAFAGAPTALATAYLEAAEPTVVRIAPLDRDAESSEVVVELKRRPGRRGHGARQPNGARGHRDGRPELHTASSVHTGSGRAARDEAAEREATRKAAAAEREAAKAADRERKAEEAAERKAAKKAAAAEREAAKAADRERKAEEAAERKAAKKAAAAEREAAKAAERERKAEEAAARKQARKNGRTTQWRTRGENGNGRVVPAHSTKPGRTAERRGSPHRKTATQQPRKRVDPAASSQGRTPGTGIHRRAIILTVAGVLAAGAGAITLATGGGGEAGHGTRINNGDLSMRLPEGWKQTHLTQGRFGSLSSSLTAAQADGKHTALLTGTMVEPSETTTAIRRLAPNGTRPVATHLGELEVTRYGGLETRRGTTGAAYVLNTTGPSVLIVCEASGTPGTGALRDCANVASSLRLENELPLSLASAKARRPAAYRALTNLGTARIADRQRIAQATLASDQSAAASDLQVSYYEASRRVEATGLPGASVAKLVTALTDTGDAYGELADAIANGSQAAYDEARDQVLAREAELWPLMPPRVAESVSDQP